ncbi:DUF3892 domain-containing protein [Agromyces italicus]|uniref:DUF3892 domain-containing protein n=1 Tax=Agromyces italicus TaxID=279572 RepID=UPI0003B5803B|nr:DUF3892 domain-containing protein [Agromyces italicus]
MPYIRRVRVQSPGTHASHITAVQYSTTTNGSLTVATPAAIARSIEAGTPFWSHNDVTSTRTLVIGRTGGNGDRYITTVANGRESDNLLRLPQF